MVYEETYTYKWDLFLKFSKGGMPHNSQEALSNIFEFLLLLVGSGLQIEVICVICSALDNNYAVSFCTSWGHLTHT